MTSTTTGSDPTAVTGRRYLAAAIDWAIGAGIGLVGFVALADSQRVFGLATCSDVPQPNMCFQSGDTVYVVEDSKALLLYGLWFAWSVGIYWVMRGLTGKTPATAMLGLVCVDDQGRPPGLPKAALRSVAGVVDYFPCCLPLVGMITIATTPGHRRVGDMAASTSMIDKAYVGQQVRTGPLPGSPAGPYGVAAGAVPPPGQGVAPPVAPGTPAAPHASAGPQWDAPRNAYVQFDQASGRWLQFDQATNQWFPIDGG